MTQEVFRFVSVRPVKEWAGAAPPLSLHLDRGDSRFLPSLYEYADPANRAKTPRQGKVVFNPCRTLNPRPGRRSAACASRF
jgi:hypothetical protein